MKKLITILAVVFINTISFAQSPPQKMSYQAIIRNSSNALVASTTVGMQISILQKSEKGDAVYIEKHSTITNANGLATIEIGGGTPVSGRFETIDWSSGPYFFKTETDPTGGSSYSITGTSKLLSVPYALYAEKSGNGDDFKQLNTKLDALATQVAGVTSLVADMSAVKSQITALQTAVAGLPNTASITALQTALTANATAIAAITTTLNTVAAAGTATKAVVDGLKTDLTALATKVATDNAALKIQITAIGTSNDAQTLQLTALVNSNTALALQITAAQATIKDAIATGNKTSDDLLNTRINALEAALKASGVIR